MLVARINIVPTNVKSKFLQIRINEDIMKTLLLILCLAAAAFPCGAPQDISGRIWNPISLRSTVTLTDGDQTFTAVTNPFGYFRFREMTPCLEYQLSVKNKWFAYPSPVFTLPGEVGVEIDLEPIELILSR